MRGRCPGCGARQDRSQETCVRCRDGLTRLCECGARAHVFDERCGACGQRLLHARWSVVPTLRRAARAALVTTALVGLPTLFALSRYQRRSELQPWRIEQAASDAFAREDWREARMYARQLVDMRPHDADAWHSLALADARLGTSPEFVVREAQRAVELAPRHGPAHTLLALQLAQLGRVEEARDHARLAARWSNAPASIWRLAADLELDRVRPDRAAALDAYERAAGAGAADAQTLVRIALLRLRMVGGVPPERYPPELAHALARAREAVARAPQDAVSPGLGEWLAAELALAEGRATHAAESCDAGLAECAAAGDAADPRLRARLLLTAARVRLAQSDTDGARALVAQALGASPAPEIVAAAADLFVADGREDAAVAALAAVPDAHDLLGAVRATRAELARRAGRLEEALALADAAVAAPQARGESRLVQGDVLRDLGRFDAAAAAYAAAAAGVDDTLPADLCRARLAATRPGATPAARVAVFEDLVARYPEAPEAAYELGRAQLDAGATDAARATFEAVASRRPWSSEAWLALATAWSRTPTAEAPLRASAAAAEALRLRPFDGQVVVAAARLAARAGDDGAAIAWTTAYLARRPGDAAARRLRAEARMRRDEWSGAVEDLELLAADPAADAVVRVLLTESYLRGGRERDAWTMLARAADDGERRSLEIVLATHASRGVDAGGDVWSSPVAVAIRHVREGHPGAALTALRAAVRRDARDVPAVRALVVLLTGSDLEEPDLASRVAEARAAVQALGDAGGEALGAYLEGRVLFADGAFDAATGPLTRAAELLQWDADVQFVAGDACFRAGRRAAAVPFLRRALWLPGARAALGRAVAERLYLAAVDAGEGAGSERLLRDALRGDPGLVPAAERLVDVLLARGDVREAGDVAVAALAAADPALAAGLRRRALAARFEAGDFEGARRQLDELDRRGDAVERAATLRGLVELQTGELPRALEILRAAAEDASDELALLGYAEALVRSGDARAAVAFVGARIAQRPQQARAAHVLTRSLARRPELVALAVENATAAAARDPDDVEAQSQLVALLGDLGRRDDALAAADRAVAQAGERTQPLARALRADVLVKLVQRPEDALEACATVLADARVDGTARHAARLVQAEALADLGRMDEARAVCRDLTGAWVDDRPTTPLDRRDEPRVRFVLGLVELHSGRVELAATQFVRALELDASLHAAANNAAWCIAQGSPRSPTALRYARFATEARPGEPSYWDTRAFCERASGLLAEAVASWTRADELLAGRPGADALRARALAAVERAETLADLGRDDDARSVARAALGLSRDDALSARARALLERN